MRVVGTVGLPGSGKGEFASVAREMDVPVVTMGDVIRRECRDRGLDPERHHGDVARRLREEDGPAAVAERSLPRIREHLDDRDVVLVDGLRSGVEVDRFRAAFGDRFLLVSVEAPFEQRFDRLRSRGRDESDLDEQSLRERERRELSFGMDEAIDRADLAVANDADLATYRDRVRSILRDPPRGEPEDRSHDGPSGESTSGSGAGDRSGDSGAGESADRDRESEDESGRRRRRSG